MTRLSKKVLLPMAALSLAVATGTMVVQNVSAYEGSSQFHPMVQALVDRFNLNPNEVESMREEYMATHQAQMHQEHQARLDAAVAAGRMTEAQRTTLQEMMSKHWPERQEMRDLSPEDRRTEANEHRDEMRAWAEANGVDLADIMPAMGEGRRGPGMGDGMGRNGAGMGQRMGYGR